MEMTPRERLLATVNFEPLDRPLRWETIGFWNETLSRWHNEGLSPDIKDQVVVMLTQGFDLQAPIMLGAHEHPGFDPLFPEEILRVEENYTIKRDFSGSIIKVFTDGNSSIPIFIESPVKDRKSWEEVKRRLDPNSEERLKPWKPFVDLAKSQPWPFTVYICGLFGTLRHLFGFENLMYAYYDQPELIHDISKHWVKMWKRVVTKISENKRPDMLSLWEDMCGKNGPLISPKMFQEFMSPYYKELIGFARNELGIPAIGVDTDGDCTPIIQKFVDAGVNVLWPFEVRAGMDVLKVRERWPNQFVIYGGIDKTKLALDKKAIEEEVLRVVPKMLEKRGYIPSLDHAVPPDVPYENWIYYRDFVREIGSKFAG